MENPFISLQRELNLPDDRMASVLLRLKNDKEYRKTILLGLDPNIRKVLSICFNSIENLLENELKVAYDELDSVSKNKSYPTAAQEEMLSNYKTIVSKAKVGKLKSYIFEALVGDTINNFHYSNDDCILSLELNTNEVINLGAEDIFGNVKDILGSTIIKLTLYAQMFNEQTAVVFVLATDKGILKTVFFSTDTNYADLFLKAEAEKKAFKKAAKALKSRLKSTI